MGFTDHQHKKRTLNLKLPFITQNNKYNVKIPKNINDNNETS